MFPKHTANGLSKLHQFVSFDVRDMFDVVGIFFNEFKALFVECCKCAYVENDCFAYQKLLYMYSFKSLSFETTEINDLFISFVNCLPLK